jgi:NAD(P)-dependent dehydrogenase (short-subunit alcohol dehydrogenase family)
MLAEGTFEGKVAIVTGGGSGLGRAIALELGRLGASVAIAGRRPEPLEETVALLAGKGLAVPTDVRDPEAVDALVAATVDELGRVDVLVNNAAGNFVVKAEDLSPNGWRAVVGIVLDGTFNCSRELARRVIARARAASPGAQRGSTRRHSPHVLTAGRAGGGQIVNVVATYAWTGNPGTVHSAAAKAGVVNLTRTLAVEWAPYGIRVNAISPGVVDTPQSREQLWADESVRAALLRRIPLGRFGREEEVANACAYLVSDYGAYVTGEVLTIDGGAWLEKGMFDLAKEE